MDVVRADEEIIELLASAPNVLEFQPSEAARARVWDLVRREKAGEITEQEKQELDRYGQIEHLLRLVKSRARKRQTQPA